MFNTNEFLLCKEILELFAVIKGLLLETHLFPSNEEMDVNRLQEFLLGVVSRNQGDMRRQTPMDFEERANLMESRTSAYCQLIKIIQVSNSIIGTNPASRQQFQSDLQTRLEPIYAKINEIRHTVQQGQYYIENITISLHLQNHKFNLQMRKSTKNTSLHC